MWHIILNCVVIAIVIAIATFGEMFAEMLISADEPRKQKRNNNNNNNYPAQQQRYY